MVENLNNKMKTTERGLSQIADTSNSSYTQHLTVLIRIIHSFIHYFIHSYLPMRVKMLYSAMVMSIEHELTVSKTFSSFKSVTTKSPDPRSNSVQCPMGCLLLS